MSLTEFQRASVRQHIHDKDAIIDPATGLPWSGGAGVSDHALLTNVTATQHHSNTNDPSSGEKAALAGTSGTPGSGNKFVTDADSRLSGATPEIKAAGRVMAAQLFR